MRKLILLLVAVSMCFILCSCSTWSGNRAIYAKSDNATIFGGWGYAHMGKGTSLLIWDNSIMTNNKEKDFVGFLPVPQIQVDSNSNLNIGKPSKYPPSGVVAESVPADSIEKTIGSVTNIPLLK